MRLLCKWFLHREADYILTGDSVRRMETPFTFLPACNESPQLKKPWLMTSPQNDREVRCKELGSGWHGHRAKLGLPRLWTFSFQEETNNISWASEIVQWVKALSCPSKQLEFNSWDSHGGRRQLTLAYWPLTSTPVLWGGHTHTHRAHIYMIYIPFIYHTHTHTGPMHTSHTYHVHTPHMHTGPTYTSHKNHVHTTHTHVHHTHPSTMNISPPVHVICTQINKIALSVCRFFFRLLWLVYIVFLTLYSRAYMSSQWRKCLDQ